MTEKKVTEESKAGEDGAVQRCVMRFVLDLSQVAKEDLPERFKGGPLIIPLEKGQFECDYDVIESEMPAEFVKKWRDYSEEPGKEMKWPLGINESHLARMPEGAILRDA